ncbi:unnamed protein product [Schistosoma turkestanicum]|nr:unnamed protein product [Schistosoma turkestanicum]
MAGMSLVHYIISDKYWVETYMSAAEQICQSIPSEGFRNTCLLYVHKYLNTTLNAMANAVKPEYICNILKACGNESISLFSRKVDFEDSLFCEACKMGYLGMQSIFTEKDQIKAMKSSMKMICVLFAADERQCNKVLQQYLDQAITYFNHRRADQFCYKICTFLKLFKNVYY